MLFEMRLTMGRHVITAVSRPEIPNSFNMPWTADNKFPVCCRFICAYEMYTKHNDIMIKLSTCFPYSRKGLNFKHVNELSTNFKGKPKQDRRYAI